MSTSESAVSAQATGTPRLHEVLPGGATWSALLRRGTLLTLTDIDGAGTATLAMLRADLTAERLNLPDTMKAQKISRITAGATLMSDMGRALATVLADDAGGHDPIGGLTDDARLEALLGPSSYQRQRNERWVSARTMLLIELAKHGLGKADLSDVVQCFSVLDVAGDGALALRHSGTPGAALVLRCELDLLVMIHAGPHPYDDAPVWPGAPIGVTLGVAAPATADEPARTARAQTARSLERSDRTALWAPQLAPGAASLDGAHAPEVPSAPEGHALNGPDDASPLDTAHGGAASSSLWPSPPPLAELPPAVRGDALPGGATLAGTPIVMADPITPPPIEGTVRLDEVIDSGDGWLRRVEPGERLRITDVAGNQAADTLFYCAEDPSIRYSWTATIAAQRNPYLTTGSVLMATEGSPLATIVADTVGYHDTVGGACARESNVVRYGEHTRYQHACRDTFVRTLLESGLSIGKRDLTANINFFMNVPLDNHGGLDFADGRSGVGHYFELEFHRPTLVLISNCPQINNPCNAFDPTPVRAEIYRPHPRDA
jgi:urea carboxylase-associated protein 1/urea carboxylase-associated protein 2